MPQLNSTYLEEYPVGYWDLFIGEGSKYVNERLKISLGYGIGEFKDTISEWKKRVVPEDVFLIFRNYLLHIKSKGEFPFALQVRLKHKNGSIIYFVFTGKVISWGEKGTPVQMMGSYLNITSKIETEKELVKVRNLLDITSSVALVGGWEMDLETESVTWTMAARKILELSDTSDTVEGMATTFFKYEIDKKVFRQALRNSIKTGTPFEFEQVMVTAKGSEVWTHSAVKPEFENGVCKRITCIFKDITEQKLSEAAIRQKQDQLISLIRHCPAEIALLDKELRYLAISDSWRSSYNLTGDSLIGQKHYQVFPEIPERWKKLHKRCLRGEVFKNELDSFVRMDGSVEWLQWEIRPWYDAIGEIGGIILFTNVVTKYHETEETLAKTKKEVENATMVKSKFLSVMSHELRTPLNAVIGFTDLLLKNPRKDQQENLNILKFSANNLLVLIDDLLDFHNIEAGKVIFEESDFSIEKLLNNIVTIHHQEVTAKHLELEFVMDPDLPEWVKGDPIRIGQVINNLVNNAVKFTPLGNVTVSVKMIKDYENTSDILFEVIDTGIGIPLDKQKLIFEIFSQANSKSSRRYGGTGIGLAATKRLLELMGSSINVQSKVGAGSVFSFTIRLKKSGKNFNNASARNPEKLYEALIGRKILLVEDNVINVILAKKLLLSWQVSFDLAENGKIALEKVLQKDYDLILMDLQMPEMDGYEATIAIRKQKDKKYKFLPILALTASAELDMVDKIHNAGMNDYIRKPFKPNELYFKLVSFVN